MKPEDPLPTRQEIREAMKSQPVQSDAALLGTPPLQAVISSLPIQSQIDLLQKQQNSHRIPEPTDKVVEPCLEVFKDGQRLGGHPLNQTRQSWSIGRALD